MLNEVMQARENARLRQLQARRRIEREFDRADELDELIDKEVELRRKLRELERPVVFWRPIKLENEIRRTKGALQMILDEEMRGSPYPLLAKPWSDSYKAHVLGIPPNPRYLEIRVFDLDGRSIITGRGLANVPLRIRDNFIEGATIFVEPSPENDGTYNLVGQYNYKGDRIG